MIDMKQFTNVMTNVKNCLIALNYPERIAQDMINRNYMLIKPTMFIEPVQTLVVRIIKQENPKTPIEEITESIVGTIQEKGFDIYSLFGYYNHSDFMKNMQMLAETLRPPKYYSKPKSKKKHDKGPHAWEINSFSGCDMYGRVYTGNF